jgi:hypothetical protein
VKQFEPALNHQAATTNVRSLLIGIGVIIFAIIIIALVNTSIDFNSPARLNKEAAAYIADNLPKIVDRWDAQNLVDRADTALIAGGATRRRQFDEMYAKFQKLGALKHLDTPEGGGAFSGAFTVKGMYPPITMGSYSVQADFEKGHATISIWLVRVDKEWKVFGKKWKVHGFDINSDVFLPLKDQPSARVQSAPSR